MKKIILLLSFLCAGWTVAWAQLPNGSTAPNFTVVDINGVSHSLYSLLDSGKTVYLDVFATWCGPCWNYHQTHALEDLWDLYGPNGTNEAYVMAIEGDASTTVNCIWGAASCSGGTVGDWTAGTPYPIADYANIMNLYQVSYYPTIFMICPADKKVYEAGQLPTSSLWDLRNDICPPLIVNTALNNVNNVRCFGTNTGSIDISVSGGSPPFVYHWSNNATSQDLNNIPAGTYTCTVTNHQGWVGVTDPITVEGPPDPLNMVMVESTPVACNGALGTVTVEASGGWSSNYNYAWNNGQLGPEAINLNPGNYTVTVTDDNACTKTLTASIAPVSYPVASIAPPATVSCANPSFQLSVSATGGYSGDYIYQWFASNGGNITAGATSATPTINAAGNYTVQVTDAATNCSDFAGVVVSGNTTLPDANAGPAMAVSCSVPAVVLQGSGSTGSGFSYLWTPSNGGAISSGANTLNPTATSSGTYTLVVSNASNGCSRTSTTTVTGNNTAPTATATGGALTCTVNALALNATTNAGNPEYAWTGPNGFSSATANPTVSTAGDYIVTIVDLLTGCTNTATANVSVNNTAPGATATGGTLTCTMSSVELNGNSATTGVVFNWSGPNGYSSAQSNPTVSEAGQYNLLVTNPSNGCTSAAAATVETNTTLPVASAATPGNLNCQNTSLQLNGAGSSQGAGFTYAWTTANGNIVSGENTLTPTVDAAGTYNLLVTNTANGCATTAATSVAQSPVVTAAISNPLNATCFGASNGAATVNAGGGNASYTYAWSNGATTAVAENLPAGTYNVVVTDGESCTASAAVTITEPAILAANTAATAQSAFGVNDGTATANPSGGTSAYTYAWSNGETSQSIVNLAPGTYVVTVTDANGCTAVQSAIVNTFNCTLSAAISSTDITCFGAGNGTAAVALTGANDPVSYTWSNGSSASSIENLAPGAYTVELVDGTNCASSLNVVITEPAALAANATATGETALGANNGTATANPSGGTSAYSYAWSNGETSQTIGNLTPNAYTVTVTDANGCTSAQIVVVNAFNCAVSAQSVTNNVTCFGMNNGAISVSIAGGSEPYTYSWSNGNSTATASNLTPGTYTATITDNSGCDVILENVVSEPALLTSTASTANPECGASQTGAIEVLATGGTAPYAYAWNNGATTSALTGLLPGTYSLVLTDANGCSLSQSYTLVATDNIAPQVTAQNATLSLNVSGTVSVNLQTLNAGVSDNCNVASVVLSPASFDCDQLGTHNVTIEAVDDAGNSTVTTVEVNVVDDLAPAVTCPGNITRCWYENVVAYDAPVAQDNCLSSGGAWNLDAGLPSGSTFPVGITTQTYTFKDASNNVGSCSFSVLITTPIDLAVASIVNDVDNQGKGAIDITVNGGSQPYSFVWTSNGVLVGTTEDLSGLFAGVYKVEIKDANGCTVGNEGVTVGNTTPTYEPAWLAGVSLRPNPTSGLTQVVFAKAPAGQLEIQVVDATGRIARTQLSENESTLKLDCTGLPDGIYLIRFRTGTEAGVRKLMVSR